MQHAHHARVGMVEDVAVRSESLTGLDFWLAVPGAPSMLLGIRSPCQWMVVGSGSLFVK
jgi:hypothetical protein